MTTLSEASRQIDETAHDQDQAVRRHVEQLRACYVHAAVFAASMIVIFTVNLLTNLSAGIAGDWSAWWSLYALLGCGAGIAVHGLVVRLNRPSVSRHSWEQRQMNRMLGKGPRSGDRRRDHPDDR